MASASCPFCNGAIDEELARFGGPCPQCFNDVPGDEAATDPGVQAQAVEAEAKRVETKKKSTRTAGVVGLLLTLALVSSALLYKQHVDSEAEKEQILAFDEEEMFVVPAEELTAAEQERLSEEAAAAEAAEARRIAALRATTESSGGDEAVADYGAGDRFADDGTGGREAASEFQEASIGTRTPGLSVGGASTDVVRKGAVLSDKKMIEDMAKMALASYGGQLKQCYEQRLKEDTSLRGAWTVIFMIEKSGATSGVQIQANNKSDADLEACMKRNVENWTFSQISAPFGPIGKTYRFGSRY